MIYQVDVPTRVTVKSETIWERESWRLKDPNSQTKAVSQSCQTGTVSDLVAVAIAANGAGCMDISSDGEGRCASELVRRGRIQTKSWARYGCDM